LKLIHLGIHRIPGRDVASELGDLNFWTWLEAIKPGFTGFHSFCFSEFSGSRIVKDSVVFTTVKGRKGEGALGILLLPFEMFFLAMGVIKSSGEEGSIILCSDPFITGLPGLLVGRLTCVPVVLYAAGNAVEVAVQKLGGEVIWFRRIIRSVFSMVARSIFRGFDEIACVSQDMARQIRPFSVARMSVCRNFASDNFVSASSDFVPGEVVLTVSRLSPEKGVGDLVEAAVDVIGLIPNTRFRIIGKGFLGEMLGQMASRRGLSCFEFLGAVPNSEMPSRYLESSLFVLPSLTEGLPISILEAMACRRPVVASSVGGIPEVIDRWVGCLVPPGDSVSLYVVLADLLGSIKVRKLMGYRGRHRVLVRFSKELYVKRFTGVLNRAMAKSGRGREAG